MWAFAHRQVFTAADRPPAPERGRRPSGAGGPGPRRPGGSGLRCSPRSPPVTRRPPRPAGGGGAAARLHPRDRVDRRGRTGRGRRRPGPAPARRCRVRAPGAGRTGTWPAAGARRRRGAGSAAAGRPRRVLGTAGRAGVGGPRGAAMSPRARRAPRPTGGGPGCACPLRLVGEFAEAPPGDGTPGHQPALGDGAFGCDEEDRVLLGDALELGQRRPAVYRDVCSRTPGHLEVSPEDRRPLRHRDLVELDGGASAVAARTGTVRSARTAWWLGS